MKEKKAGKLKCGERKKVEKELDMGIERGKGGKRIRDVEEEEKVERDRDVEEKEKEKSYLLMWMKRT